MKKQFFVLSLVAIMIFITSCEKSNNPPTTPMLSASSMQVSSNTQVSLTAMATDPDGDPITFLWQATGGSFSSTTGNSVVWTSPATTGIFTITVEASDSKGTSSASSSNSINITVSIGSGGTGVIPGGGGVIPGGGGGGSVVPTEIEVIVGDKSEGLWGPFPTGRRSYGLTQYLYYASEIGMPGKIKRIAIMSNSHYKKTYTNGMIRMAMVKRDELTGKRPDNFEGAVPNPVFTAPTIITGGKDNDFGLWHEFSLATPFVYDGASNLLIEFEVNGDGGDPGSTGSYAFSTKVGKNRYLELLQPEWKENRTVTPHMGAIHLRLVFEI